MYENAQNESKKYSMIGFPLVPKIIMSGGVPRSSQPHSNFAEFLGENPNRFRRYRTLLRSMLHSENEEKRQRDSRTQVPRHDTHQDSRAALNEARLLRRSDVGERGLAFQYDWDFDRCRPLQTRTLKRFKFFRVQLKGLKASRLSALLPCDLCCVLQG